MCFTCVIYEYFVQLISLSAFYCLPKCVCVVNNFLYANDMVKQQEVMET